MLVWAYRGLSYLLAPIFWLYQRRSIIRGRETPSMAAERWGRASVARPNGGQLVWIHSSTIGDSIAVLRVLKQLLENDDQLHFVLTTQSSNARAVLQPMLPPRVFHQLIPCEYRPAIARFLSHWRPDLVVWTESELWPSILDMLASRNLRRVIINGRLSAKSYRGYRRFARTMRYLLGGFDWAQVQNAESAKNLIALGCAKGRVELVGSTKEASPRLAVKIEELDKFRAQTGARPCWLAASSHQPEFETIHAAQCLIKQQVPEMLLLHVPRHPEDGYLILEAARKVGLSAAARSSGAEITSNLDVYCCDTLGEMGLWHSLTSICFVAGSLCDVGGHNPFEAVAFQNAVIHGPEVSNFPDVYTRYDAAGAAIKVHDAQSLATAVLQLMHPIAYLAQTLAADAERAMGAASFQRTCTRLGAQIALIKAS